MTQPIDQGAIIRSGMELVPNLAGQMVQERNLRLLEQANTIRAQQESRQLAEASRKFERQQAFDADIAEIGANPSPGAIAGLMSKYPEFSEGLKRAWDAGSEEKRGRDMGQLGEVYSYLSSGNVERAKSVLRARVEAERAAGLEPDEEGLLAMLEGGDQEAVKQVQAQVGMALAVAAGPDKFASAYGGLKPDKTTFEQEYDFILRTQGKDAADNFMRNKSDPLTPITNQYGTSIYRSSQLDPSRGPNPGGVPVMTGIAGGEFDANGRPTSTAAWMEQMIPITLRSESNGKRYGRDGGLTTSPKGAKGEMQVMPGTITDPGYGVRAAENNSPDEIARVGRDYLAAMMARYGNDPAKAWAAYNWGPGNLDGVLDLHGGNWRKHIPAETRRYLNKNLAALKKGAGATTDKAPARISTRQQYAKLPSGTSYIAPDGTTRVKP